MYTGKRGYPPTYAQLHAQPKGLFLAWDRG